MKNLNVKVFVYILLVLSVVIGAILLYITETKVTGLWDAVKHIPTIVSIDLLLWFIFVKWAWRFKIFQNWLVPFPCLQGTWEGLIQTTWKDPQTGEQPKPISVILVVEQSFISISCVMFSKEMRSQSYAAQFLIHPESSSKKLTYTYSSVPNACVRERSGIHDGTVLVDIIEKPNKALSGEYWTARKTTGDIRLKFRCAELLQAFPEEVQQKTVTEVKY